MKNADRIRKMTDEELSMMLMCPAEYDLNFNRTFVCNSGMNRNCAACTKQWLQSEEIKE